MHALATVETDALTDPALLAEIMEAREELESATTPEQVEAVRQTNAGKPAPLYFLESRSPTSVAHTEKVKATTASIKDAFSADPPNLAGAKVLAVALKYWQGLEEAAKEWSPQRQT